VRPPRSILSPTLLLQKPLMSVLIRIIEVEIARLTDQQGLGKRVKQQAEIMRILLMRRKDVREILPYDRLSLVTTRWTSAPSYSLPSCPSSWIHAQGNVDAKRSNPQTNGSVSVIIGCSLAGDLPTPNLNAHGRAARHHRTARGT
jgi:hypothetical protein